ncbi:lipase family protein [Hyalangium gracile]|uniref:lipase family protein n=1 Tax=Hyalangium gracile TaxID=394092 RepID=UPI001CCD47B7|nr:lipase family protein [Hyalangium gracile]
MTQPTLPAIAIPMGQANVAAFAAFQKKSWTAPSGWKQVDQVTGWDTIFSVLGSEELYAFLWQSTSDSSQFLIGFRGTANPTDLEDDTFYFTTSFSAWNASSTPTPTPQVAKGWYGIYTKTGGSMTASMQAQLFALISKWNIQTLYISGHSLGGALAELFALDLAVSLPSVSATILTYAAPMVGIESWTSAYAANSTTAATIRVVNQYDIVPALPPRTVAPNYGQVGQEFDVSFRDPNESILHELRNLEIRHEMFNYLTVVTTLLLNPPQQWPFSFTDGVYNGQNGQPLITDEAYQPSSAAVQNRDALLAARRQSKARTAAAS